MDFRTQKFIERIQGFDVLYNRVNSTSNIQQRTEIWGIISEEFGCDAKKKWQGLRDRYVRERKKLMNTPGSDSNWRFYEAMNFLNDYSHKKSIKAEKFEIRNDGENTMESVSQLYNNFCDEFTGQTFVESTRVENFNTDSCEVQSNVDPIQEQFEEPPIKFSNKQKNHRSKDEDSVFLELLAIKMTKMTLLEKSNFQLEILKKADEIIIKKE